MKKFSITQSYKNKKIMVTAHRGFSGKYPENTMLAFREALKMDIDMLEFDIRATRQNVPVILHDPGIDRTSDGKGRPGSMSLEELRKFNYSWWDGPHVGGGKGRLDAPDCEFEAIPTFEDLLQEVGGKVGLNIQVYETSEAFLKEICRLYKEYDLYDQGYLTLDTFREADMVRAIDSEVEVSVIDRQGSLDRDFVKKCKDYGCRIIQPLRQDVTPEQCRMFREVGVHANMFFSNTDEDNRHFIECGIPGILTDYPDILLSTLKDLGLR